LARSPYRDCLIAQYRGVLADPGGTVNDDHIAVKPYVPADAAAVAGLLVRAGWARRYAEGQLVTLAALAENPDGVAMVAVSNRRLVGYAAADFHAFNRLGRVHGLVVHPDFRRTGVATMLIDAAEEFLLGKAARGCYVETPVDNDGGRAFYEAAGYTAGCVMERFYADDLDGVTYVHFFDTPLLSSSRAGALQS
jgi:ribosomal-protein-alanine N-acetyltransferase